MPPSDYSSIGGGALKIKGSKPAGVEKKRKKKKPSTATVSEEKSAPRDSPAYDDKKRNDGEDDDHDRDVEREDVERTEEGSDTALQPVIKTKAERQQEERRRKRLDDRLKREGVKTHKERVEELNKYLSNLSEHHDMPRIGPG